MDKETLSNYGWIVICVLVLAVMLALATPFGQFVADGFKATYTGLFQTGDNALDVGLSAVGVSNKLPCGHGRKEVGDHSQKECGHYNCQDTDCGCVPASCGVEGHWSNDGKDHSVATSCSKHDYVCQCSGWTIPEGGTYTITRTETANEKKIYNAGEQLPCGYSSRLDDIYTCEDYRYRFNSSYDGWEVSLNTEVTDKNQTSYGKIADNINGKVIIDAANLYENCINLIIAPEIPEGVREMYKTFAGCTSLTTAPIIPSTVDNMCGTFRDCTSLVGMITINTNNITMIHNGSYGSGVGTGKCATCFYNVDMSNVTLTGSASKDVLNLIGSTGNNWTPIE